MSAVAGCHSARHHVGLAQIGKKGICKSDTASSFELQIWGGNFDLMENPCGREVSRPTEVGRVDVTTVVPSLLNSRRNGNKKRNGPNSLTGAKQLVTLKRGLTKGFLLATRSEKRRKKTRTRRASEVNQSSIPRPPTILQSSRRKLCNPLHTQGLISSLESGSSRLRLATCWK